MANKSLKVPEEYVLPVQPKTPPVAEAMGVGARTPVYNETTAVKQLEDAAALQNAVQQGTAPAQNQPQTAAQGQEKAYTMEQLEAFQQEMSAQDKAEMQALGQTIYRAGKYTNTPSATTIRLATPIDGMWYYDYGEKQYLNKWNTTPQGGNAPQATPGQTSGGIQPEGTSGVGAPVQGAGDLTSLLEEWKKAAAEQANGQIDYAVAQAITQLERALEDSKGMYKEQAESVARDEMQALDNSALYAEMRGDKGGIGQSQYNEIQAAAAQNRLTVQQAQTKLATDTARQIADLRAQGEFEKADKALEITQQYLSQLINLEQWAAEFGLSRAQFEASLEQWQAEYDMAMKEFDYNVATNERGYTASMAEALMAAGVPLDDAQLKALGWSRDQYNEYLRQQELKKAAGVEPVEPVVTNYVEKLLSFSNDAEAYTYLTGINATQSEKEKLWGMYQDAKSEDGKGDGPVGRLSRDEDFEIIDRMLKEGKTANDIWNYLDSVSLRDEEKLRIAKMYGLN